MAISKMVSRLLLLLAGFGVVTAGAQHDSHDAPHSAAPDQVGKVSFDVTCSDAAQAEFNQAMAFFHSFWFQPAIGSFTKVLELDPACGMAHWGISIMSMGNPFAWPPGSEAVNAAASAASDAKRVGARSDRERAYIDALSDFFENRDSVDYRTRATAFEKAMGELVAMYPMDDEAQIVHALLLIATAQPQDKSFGNQLKAAAALEPLFAKYPNHPGVAHYLIHAYDSVELAERGLTAAREYAKIAPAVPHALHMPSHLFSRVGLWPEMVESNLASYQAAKGELQQTTFETGTYDALHAMDYLVFAHLQQAQDVAAKSYVDELASIRKVDVENFIVAYAFAAIPARYALERGDWQQAARLELSPPDLAWSRFPQAEAIHVFARGLGAARSGDAASARKAVQRLEALRDALRSSGSDYWAGQTEFQISTIDAWIALDEQREQDALRLMRVAADAEDASDKHPVTPGNVAPSRELLAEMLLLIGNPGEALTEFERSLRRDPNRLRSTHGAALAAHFAGDSEAAQRHCAALQALIAHRDTDRVSCPVTKSHASP